MVVTWIPDRDGVALDCVVFARLSPGPESKRAQVRKTPATPKLRGALVLLAVSISEVACNIG